MDTECEEELMETETYSPQKASTSRGVQITPKCDQNVQVDARSSSDETSTSGYTTTTDAPLALWVKGKEFLLRNCQNFMMKMVWHIPATTFHHSQKSVQESNYNLLNFKSICYIVYLNKLTW